MKMPSYQYSDSHCNWRLTYLYNGNPYTWRKGLYIERGSRKCFMCIASFIGSLKPPTNVSDSVKNDSSDTFYGLKKKRVLSRMSLWISAQVLSWCVMPWEVKPIINKTQSGASITQSIITGFSLHYWSDWSRIQIRVWTHKRHPIPQPDGWAMGCLLWSLG